MAAPHTNPRITQIRQRVKSSYDSFRSLLAGPLTTLDPALLYKEPTEGEWTIMQNLAHLVEFMPYWADEIKKLVAEPDQNFGRTMQQPRRLQAIEDHGHDHLEQIRALLPTSYAHLERVLTGLTDLDLDLTGVHVKFGKQTLGWFIEEFVTGHLEAHLAQVQAALASLQPAS